jgi:tetratricopeptide (TPR) repeat protein
MVRDKDRIFDLAQKMSHKKGLKKTIKEYQHILDKNPNDIKTRIKLGDVCLRRGNLEKAIKEYFKIGEHYITEELDLKAIAMFKRILVLNPAMIDSYYKLADLYYKRGLFGETRLQYEKILEIDPKNKKARDGLAGLRMIESKATKTSAPGGDVLQGTESKATKTSASRKSLVEDITRKEDPVWNAILQDLQRQLSAQLREDDYQTHYHLGIAFKEMGLLQKAIEEFQSAIADPDLEFYSYLMIGTCCREIGNYNKALEYLKKGLRIKPLTKQQYEDLYFQLGLTLEEGGQTKEALEAFTKVIELKGREVSAELRLKVAKLKDQMLDG